MTRFSNLPKCPIQNCRRLSLTALCLLGSLMVACTKPASKPAAAQIWPRVSNPIAHNEVQEQAIAKLLATMTLEQKVAQMIQPDIRWISVEDMRRYGFGSYQTGGDAYPNKDKYAPLRDWVAMADSYYEASLDASLDGSTIPTLWASDAVHGLNNMVGATIFPHNIALGATHNPALIKQIGAATAQEVRTAGIDMAFAPTLAVARDDHWGRAYESYSENPALVRTYAKQMVEGLQGSYGPGFLQGDHVIATAKHFIGDGGTDQGKDQGDTRVSEQELFDIHGQGYVGALEAGTQAVMASFNSWQGDKLHGQGYLLTEVLKKRMGFDGMLVGDWNGHGQVPGCTNDSCAAAVNAGLDIFLVPENWKGLYENTLAQVRAGEIAQTRIDDAVRRILRVKMRAGLFDAPRPSARLHAADENLLGAPAHRAIARQAVRESLVLLKNQAPAGQPNQSPLLPLSPKGRYLVAGDGADNIGKQTGGWTISWQGADNKNSDFPGGTSILAGIQQAVSAVGGTVEYNVKGIYSRKPDAAIVVFGENPYAEGVGDIAQFEYQYPQKTDLQLLQKLRAQGIPTVAIFLTGRPLWVNKELNASDAFVVAWLPGSEGGGVADVIFSAADGKPAHDFKGKLPFSWPKKVDQTTLNLGDKNYDPLFAYGYGLSYQKRDTRSYPLPEQGYATQAQQLLKLFDRTAIAPWELHQSDSENIVLTAIDRKVQADARAVKWSGQHAASISLRSQTQQNLSRYIEHGTLSMSLRMMSAPTAPLILKFGCGKSCAENKGVDLGAKLTKRPLGEWQDLSIDLSCFNKPGQVYLNVTQVVSLSTAGKLALDFSDIQLAPVGDTEADVVCD